ncbi:universal stress protein [Nitrospira sp. Kam-Ns4a]
MRILLAVDGSDNAYEAARAVGHLAPPERLLVLHVIEVPKPAYPMMLPEVAAELYATVEVGMREDAERLLDRIVSVLPLHAGPVARCIEPGRPAEAILAAAAQEGVDLILVGARGLGPVKELVFGSVSHRVITHAPCPVLVVNRPLRALGHALLAVQEPEDAERAVAFLAKKPFREPPRIAVLTVMPLAQPLWPVGVTGDAMLMEKAVECARHLVDDVADRLTRLGYAASGLLNMGAPAAAILQSAGTLKPDLILVGSHGRAGVSRFLLGSVSHTVLHQAPCPVLVVR